MDVPRMLPQTENSVNDHFGTMPPADRRAPASDHWLWSRCRPDTEPDGHRHVPDLLGEFTPYVQPLPPLAGLAQLNGAQRLFGASAQRQGTVPWDAAQRPGQPGRTATATDVTYGSSSSPPGNSRARCFRSAVRKAVAPGSPSTMKAE